MSDIGSRRHSIIIQVCLVLALLLFKPLLAAAQTTRVPPAPLIHDAWFDSKPINIGTQPKYLRPLNRVRQADGKRVVAGASRLITRGSPPYDYCPNIIIILSRYDVDGRCAKW